MKAMEPSNRTDTDRLWAILVTVAAISFAVSPFVVTPFSGFEPGRFPVPVDTPPIQPAGWAFSIWGLIYLWLVAGAVFGLLKRADAPDWRAHRPAAFASLAIGSIWLPVANASPIWATILILAMLVAALVALARAPARDAPWARWPLGLYAGWLTAASFVSLATLAAGYGLATAQTASWIALPLAVLIAAGVTLRLGTSTYPAAAAWAAIGIALANWPGPYALAALAGAVALALLAALSATRTP